jgi:hypothetical protein
MHGPGDLLFQGLNNQMRALQAKLARFKRLLEQATAAELACRRANPQQENAVAARWTGGPAAPAGQIKIKIRKGAIPVIRALRDSNDMVEAFGLKVRIASSASSA